MIFTESTIKISNNVSKMDSTIVLYRGDKNVEIRFTILQSPFKYSNTVATNVIESTNASYGQLVIKTPNDKPPIFSEVSATKEGTVLFTITKEMIDEIEELGVYTFQIRLLDENKQSRVTIPPVENGIEIKEPIAIEDDNSTNVVGLAKANYAVATLSDVNTPTFDDNGKYNKTNWNDGDIITNASLNKIEDGIYTTNENIVIRPLPVHSIAETDKTIAKTVNIMDLVPGVIYSTYKDISQTKTESYRVVYICDDGTFRLVCTLPLKNKNVHLVKALHYTNYSTVSYNNIDYKVDYSKHSTNTDIQITKTLQNYLPIANNIEYTPTREYHPATKKYADDKFICADIVDNVGTIPKEELQKCNNGTSRYVSSIKFKEFFADYEHCIYQGTYGDKKIRMKYDKDYNRMIAYDLTDVIELGFEFDNNYMYPFNAGTDEVKSYQFTNDLVITKSPMLNPSEVLTKNNTHEYTPTNDYNPATKKYVDDKITGGGINSTAKNLLQTILQNAVYTSNQSANITALISALGSNESGGGDIPTVKTYTITNNLTHCSNSNASTSVNENSNYAATITPSKDYTLADASVNITMGGTDITSTAYNNGAINITSVTGNIVITITATSSSSSSEMVTDGLVNYFDFRNAKYNNDGAGGSTIINATQGNGSLFNWGKNTITAQDDYGITITRSCSYNANSVGTTDTNIKGTFTAAFLGYTTNDKNLFGAWSGYTNIATQIKLNPSYINTSNSVATVPTEIYSTNDGTAYRSLVLTADKATGIAKMYLGGSLIKTYTGSDYSDFNEWVITLVGPTQSSVVKATSMIVYDRVLSDVEIMDTVAFFKTLEVSK